MYKYNMLYTIKFIRYVLPKKYNMHFKIKGKIYDICSEVG